MTINYEYYGSQTGVLKTTQEPTIETTEAEIIYLTTPRKNNHTRAMAGQRHSVYPNTNPRPPGRNIYVLRAEVLDMSQREFSRRCEPAIDNTTLQRIEKGGSYRRSTLLIIAKAFSKYLAKNITVEDLFLPPEIQSYALLTDDNKAAIRQNIEWALQSQRLEKPRVFAVPKESS